MKFVIQLNSGLYPETQHQKPMNFDYFSGNPEMKCLNMDGIELFFHDLTKNIKVDNSIDDWTLSIVIILGGAMNEKEIAIYKRGFTYINDKERSVSVRIPLPTSEQASWGISKKHRFNEYTKRKTDNGFTILPVDYDQFNNMTDYIESSIKLSLMRLFKDGITLKRGKIKI